MSSQSTSGPAVLVTGGAGYIGSHTIVELLAAGFQIVCVDNFCNSTPQALQRIERIAGRPVRLVEGDIRDAATLDRAFSSAPIAAVIHFAALKAVGESVARPLDYYDNNVGGTIALLRGCERAAVKRLVFSSSATVYGVPERLPLTEDMPLSAVNPYGATKIVVEQMLRDACGADPHMSVVSLRYFNPIGAHFSGLIGEDPRDMPDNLFPFITQVASADVNACRYSATIGRRPTAPECATISTSWTWRRGMCARFSSASATPAFQSSGDGARQRAGAGAPSETPAGDRSRTRWSAGERATWRRAGPMPAGRASYSTGRPTARLSRCARMDGAGSRPIQTATDPLALEIHLTPPGDASDLASARIDVVDKGDQFEILVDLPGARR